MKFKKKHQGIRIFKEHKAYRDTETHYVST